MALRWKHLFNSYLGYRFDQPVTDLGVNYALIRFPAKLTFEGNYCGAAKIIRLGVLLKLSVSTAAFLICYCGAERIAVYVLNRPELVPSLRLASALIVFEALFYAAMNSFIGLDRAEYSALIQLAQASVRSVLAPAFVLLGLGVEGAIFGQMLSSLGAGLMGILFLFTKHIRSMGTAKGDSSLEVRTMLGYSLPLYWGTILMVFLSEYMKIVLAYFATDLEIGNFNVALNISLLFNIFSYPIGTTMLAAFSKVDPQGEGDDFRRLFRLAMKYTSLLVIPLSVSIMLLSGDLVRIIYGKSYTLAPQYVMMHAALFLWAGLGYLMVDVFLSGIGDPKSALKIAIVTFAVFTPLAPATTRFWHIPGLVAAFILANGISVLYGVRKASNRYGVSPDLKDSIRIYLAALTAALPCIVLIRLGVVNTGMVELVICGTAYMFSYLTLAPMLGAVQQSDIRNLATILARNPIAKTLGEPFLKYEARVLSFAALLRKV